jgi:4a-hydroxytetrahydrobiopterin dehydratase
MFMRRARRSTSSRWNAVTLTLTTHDAGGLTERDFALAASIDAL